jgi:tetratricopeptide (TPR) repeat protein
MNYGLTQMQKANYVAAKAMFQRAAVFTPDYGILEINRGIVEGALGDGKAAESHFRRALELDRSASAHFFYGRWLVNSGRGAEALPELERALRLSPSFVDARGILLKLYLAAGRDAQFAALAGETRRIDPAAQALADVAKTWDSYDAAFRDGFAAIGRKDWIAAAIATRAAIRFNPRSLDAWNNLGWILAQLGFPDEPARAYEQALAIDPAFERAANNLQMLRPLSRSQ